MKKFRILLCILLSICMLTACGKKDSNKNNNNEPVLPTDSKEFVEYVETIIIDLNAKEKIDRAFEMYNALGDDSWNYDAVIDAYEELCGYEDEYNTLLNDTKSVDNFIDKVQKIPTSLTIANEYLILEARKAYNDMSDKAKMLLGVEYNLNILAKREKEMEELKATAESGALKEEAKDFLNACAALKNSEQITLDDKDALDNCQKLYEKLSSDAKALEAVVKAYETLDKCIKRYNYLLEHPEILENVNKENFLNAANQLPDEITLSDITVIKDAENAYKKLTEEQKQDAEIVAAAEKLVAARNKYDELYKIELEKEAEEALKKECENFINLVEQIETPITINSFLVLNNASAAYASLSEKAKQDENVKSAYEKLENYFNEYDNLTELPRVTFDLYNILAGGGTGLNVVLQGANALLYPGLKSLYGVSDNVSLAEKCNLYLVFYKYGNSEPLFEGNITSALKASSEDVASSVIIEMLQNASISNKEIVSGWYTFGLKVKDLSGSYRDSEIFIPKNGSAFNYVFASLYEDETTEKDTIKISTLEELLNIKNNLSGSYILMNDIDVSSIPWENLGNFSGRLNGNGHAIKGLNCEIGPEDAFGIFLEIAASGIVENLVVTGDVKNAGTWAGLIAVRNRGQIKNCFINVKMASSGKTTESGNIGDACIGGVVCENFGSIANVIVVSKIEGTGTQYGQLDGGICVGNYGQITNSYCQIDNVSTGRVIGNAEGTYTQFGKTYEELLDKSLYDNFDKLIWEIIDGYLPELRVTEE